METGGLSEVFERDTTRCTLPKPRATDMPGHYIVHEPNDHIYSIPLGTLGQDEHMNQWRLTEEGWVPWD